MSATATLDQFRHAIEQEGLASPYAGPSEHGD
jgi:hypothetical protein